jgi:hypothetical protein
MPIKIESSTILAGALGLTIGAMSAWVYISMSLPKARISAGIGYDQCVLLRDYVKDAAMDSFHDKKAIYEAYRKLIGAVSFPENDASRSASEASEALSLSAKAMPHERVEATANVFKTHCPFDD